MREPFQFDFLSFFGTRPPLPGSSVSESIYGRLPTLTSLTARTSLSHGGSHQAAQAQHSGQLNYLSIRIIHLRAFSCRGSGFGKCEANGFLKWIYFYSPPAGDRVYSRRQGPDFTSGQQRNQEEIYFPASSLFSTVDFIKAPISKLQLHPALKAARLGNVDTPNWL